MAGIAFWPELYWCEVCKKRLAVIFFNIVNLFLSSPVKKLHRFFKDGVIYTFGSIFSLVGMACRPLRFQVAVFLFNGLECLEILKRLLFAVAPYNLNPFRAFYILHAFYEVARHIRPSIQHVLIDGVEDGLGHKLAGAPLLFQAIFLFLFYNRIG